MDCTELNLRLRQLQMLLSPVNVDELHSFIGLIANYDTFLPNMAALLSLLYKLLESKRSWKWELPQKEAFQKAKYV